MTEEERQQVRSSILSTTIEIVFNIPPDRSCKYSIVKVSPTVWRIESGYSVRIPPTRYNYYLYNGKWETCGNNYDHFTSQEEAFLALLGELPGLVPPNIAEQLLKFGAAS